MWSFVYSTKCDDAMIMCDEYIRPKLLYEIGFTDATTVDCKNRVRDFRFGYCLNFGLRWIKLYIP